MPKIQMMMALFGLVLLNTLNLSSAVEVEFGIHGDDKRLKGLEAEMEEEWGQVSGLIIDSYNKTIKYFKEEVDHLGMTDTQKYGVILIFTISSILLLTSIIFLCYGSKRCCCQGRRSDEEKYIVYRRMVEIDHIIAKPPKQTDQGKLPI